MEDVFYWIFNMSVVSSVAVAAVLLLRMIGKIPRRAIAVIWAIPALRMVLPFGLSGKYSLAALIDKLFTKTVVKVVPFRSGQLSTMNYLQGAASYFPMVYKEGFPTGLFRVFGIVWACVAAALFTAFLIIYIVTMREIKDAKPLGDGVYLSDKVTVPAVYGVIRPKIVLPAATEDDRYIIMHERAHIKRGDNVFRVLALAAVCVHWFNPLCWIFLKTYYADCELACDEAVAAGLTAEEKKEYARAISKQMPVPVANRR